MRNTFEEWKIVDCLFEGLSEICGYIVCVFFLWKHSCGHCRARENVSSVQSGWDFAWLVLQKEERASHLRVFTKE